jgi:hypothetical protein
VLTKKDGTTHHISDLVKQHIASGDVNICLRFGDGADRITETVSDNIRQLLAGF